MSDRRSTLARLLRLTACVALLGAGCATPIEIPGTAGLSDAGRSAARDGASGGLADSAAESRDLGDLPPPPLLVDAGYAVDTSNGGRDGGVVPPGDGAPGDGAPEDGDAADATADGALPDSDAGDASAHDATAGDGISGDDGAGNDATALP